MVSSEKVVVWVMCGVSVCCVVCGRGNRLQLMRPSGLRPAAAPRSLPPSHRPLPPALSRLPPNLLAPDTEKSKRLIVGTVPPHATRTHRQKPSHATHSHTDTALINTRTVTDTRRPAASCPPRAHTAHQRSHRLLLALPHQRSYRLLLALPHQRSYRRYCRNRLHATF